MTCEKWWLVDKCEKVDMQNRFYFEPGDVGTESVSVYVPTGNRRLLLRLERSFGDVCLLSTDDGDAVVRVQLPAGGLSSSRYRTLSELCRCGVRTRELWTISWDWDTEFLISK